MLNVESEIVNVSSFECFELDERLLKAVAKLGFTEPTPIQEKAIPVLLSGRDIIGRARTGSGKTAAFGLPLVQAVTAKPKGGVRAMVVTPTRELALQVTEALRTYSAGTGIKFVTIYGGSPYAPQFRALDSGVPVVVGTPGRLIDHLERGSLDLSNLDLLVLDEADEMLRMGFIEDINKLLAATPETRQVALFSATMPREIRRVANAYLKNPVEVQVEGGVHAVDHIEQGAMLVPRRFKMDALVRVLQAKPLGATLVFSQTRAGCADAAEALSKRGFAVDALHGDMSQHLRERVLGRFRRKQLDVVVATDVASRGIDVQHITHVINLDLPRDTETYVHRIGRTGRAGRKGNAISFVTPAERRRVAILERTLKTTIERLQVPTDADIAKRHQSELHTDLKAAFEDKSELLSELPEFLEAGEWTVEELALAAVRLLASERGLNFDREANPGPPEWARVPVRGREPRGASRDRGQQNFERAPNEVELVLFTGRSNGIRPGDLVGALTGETGVPGRLLARITISDNKSFVGCSKETAERILASHSSVQIRGQNVNMALARPGRPAPSRGSGRPHKGDRSRPRSESRSDRPRSASKPGKFKPSKPAKFKPSKPAKFKPSKPGATNGKSGKPVSNKPKNGKPVSNKPRVKIKSKYKVKGHAGKPGSGPIKRSKARVGSKGSSGHQSAP